MLVQSDTTDESSTFSDASGSNHTLAKTGTVNHETDQKKFGSSSIFFQGSDDYLSVADSDDWDFGTGEFTVELWLKSTRDGTSGSQLLSTKSSGWASGNGWALVHWGVSGHMSFQNGTTIYQDNNQSDGVDIGFSGNWHHVAVTRSGTSLRFFVDGDLKKTFTISATLAFDSDGSGLRIGSNWSSHEAMGYMEDIRITKGVA